MTQADSVHSTPRRTAPKIHDQCITRKTQVYSELESQMTECLMQAKVAAIVVHDTLSNVEPSVTANQAMAVMHAVYH